MIGREIEKKSLNLIITISPFLNTCLVVGVWYTFSRLKGENIIYINRERYNFLGKINFFVFDKIEI